MKRREALTEHASRGVGTKVASILTLAIQITSSFVRARPSEKFVLLAQEVRHEAI